MSPSLEERRDLWCQPISESSFAGTSSRYDERYEELLAETGKASSVHGDICNWDLVYECADDLLRNKTKDMTVLGALCIALVKREGFVGLAAGLETYGHLMRHHSEALFPNAKRLRGRAGAYTWLTEQLIRELEQAEADPTQHQGYAAAAAQFRQLDEQIRQQLQELHPRVSPISRRLDQLVEETRATRAVPAPVPPAEPPPAVEEASAPEPEPSAPEPEPQPEPRPAPPLPPLQALATDQQVLPARKPAIPEVIEDEEQAGVVFELAVTALRKLARFHLERSPARALGYQLAHLASYVGVVPDGDRAAGGPSPRRMSELRQALDERRWDDVLAAVPGILDDGELDLDVESCLAVAREPRGPEGALGTVNSQALAQYLMLGEMARVSGDTAAWLEGLTASDEAPAAAAETDAPQADRVAEVIAEAERQAGRLGLEQGCTFLQRELRGAVTRSVRFRLQLATASICLREGAADMARAILSSLRQELEEPIRTWEPELLVQVLTRLLECIHHLVEADASDAAEAGALRQEAEQLLSSLAQIDPPAALRERARWRHD